MKSAAVPCAAFAVFWFLVFFVAANAPDPLGAVDPNPPGQAAVGTYAIGSGAIIDTRTGEIVDLVIFDGKRRRWRSQEPSR